MSTATRHQLTVSPGLEVSTLWLAPAQPRTAFVFAHGAGAGMEHPGMTSIADALYARDVATLRYQFPYMERGSHRTDPPSLCHATVRSAVAQLSSRFGDSVPRVNWFAGGRSFGARMTSQAQAVSPLEGIVGLIFVGFPLHPKDKPGADRADHLKDVKIPMLFLQGTRDELAELRPLQGVCVSLQDRATLKLLAGADHSFHVRRMDGRSNQQVHDELIDSMVSWMTAPTFGNPR